MRVDREKFKAYVENWSFIHGDSALVPREHQENCLVLLRDLGECETQALQDLELYNEFVMKLQAQINRLQAVLSRLSQRKPEPVKTSPWICPRCKQEGYPSDDVAWDKSSDRLIYPDRPDRKEHWHLPTVCNRCKRQLEDD